MFQPFAEPVKLFARGGAGVNERTHSIESFRLGLRLGATGLQGDVWASSEQDAVLDSEGQIGSRLRRRRISDVATVELVDKKILLSDLYADLGSEFDLMLDVRDPDAFGSILDSATAAGALDHLWIVSSDLAMLESWRERAPEVQFVHRVRLADLPRGPEQHAATLRKGGITAVSLGFDEWTAGHVALFHRFTRLAIATGPLHERQIRDVLSMGIDAIVSPQVERMVDVAGS